MKKYFQIFFILLFIFSCSIEEKDTGEVKAQEETIEELKEQPREELSQAIPRKEPVRIEKRSGNFAMSCPEEMEINNVYDVIGVFSLSLSQEELESFGKNVLQEHGDIYLDQTIISDSIYFYDYIELRLIDPTNDNFRIIEVHKTNKQKVYKDGVREAWHWKVLPLKVNSNAQLILSLIIYDLNNNVIENLSRTYKINIKTDKSYFINEFINYLYKNPTWLLTTIIIPLVIFFYKQNKKIKKLDNYEKKNRKFR